MTVWICAVVVAFAVGYACGFFAGDDYGTKDTERRWSDAVGRAHDH